MSWVISIKTKLIIKPINISYKSIVTKDIGNILAIEESIFSHPWNRSKFISSINNSNVIKQAILIDKEIMGYSLVSIAADSADILNICIDNQYQQQGLGYKLFKYVENKLKKLKVNSIFIEVRESNIQALDFYQKLGFEYIDTRKKYYSNHENAKILRLKIT